MQPGDWVTVDQFGLRGQHGRVVAVRLDGTTDIRLDGSSLVVKRIPAKNVALYQPAQPAGEHSDPEAPGGGFQPGERVVVHVLGFRGKTGTVEHVRPDGSYDVRLDDPRSLVTRVPAAKLTAAPS
jgi:hypothetical protein